MGAGIIVFSFSAVSSAMWKAGRRAIAPVCCRVSGTGIRGNFVSDRTCAGRTSK
jgi:hypothetical protein